MRNTPAEFGALKMKIYEPCNYTSNVAYYHAATQICDFKGWGMDQKFVKAQKRNFANLAMGSAFKHASDTAAGGMFDSTMIALFT